MHKYTHTHTHNIENEKEKNVIENKLLMLTEAINISLYTVSGKNGPLNMSKYE